LTASEVDSDPVHDGEEVLDLAADRGDAALDGRVPAVSADPDHAGVKVLGKRQLDELAGLDAALVIREGRLGEPRVAGPKHLDQLAVRASHWSPLPRVVRGL
jgi:hypothetical protein